MSLKQVARNMLASFNAKLPPGLLTDGQFFDKYQRAGWHATPVHFYQPIPDTRDLGDEIWQRLSELVGVDMNASSQLELLEEFRRILQSDSPDLKTESTEPALSRQGPFGPVDAETLYCMIRKFKPRTVIEIGSGKSTLIAASAIRQNLILDNHESELIAIEPFPNQTLKNGFPGLTQLREKRIQDVPLDEFDQLCENDVLFIDSSHVVRIGGDVNYEFLEILPRLAEGVLVHVHDIFLPAEYPKEWVVDRHIFWTEQYLLWAFLCFNSDFEVLWGSSYMHLKHPERLSSCFERYSPQQNWPASFWMRRTKR